jgi:hypothetical protein
MVNLLEKTAVIIVNAQSCPDGIAVADGPLTQVLTKADGLGPKGHLLKLRQNHLETPVFIAAPGGGSMSARRPSFTQSMDWHDWLGLINHWGQFGFQKGPAAGIAKANV